jgi:hypothetical protein
MLAVSDAGDHRRRPRLTLGRCRRPCRRPPRDEHEDRAEERHGVDGEHPAGAGARDQDATDGRPDGASDVERHRAERDGLREVVLVDQVGLDRLPRRAGHRHAGAERERQREHAEGRDRVGEGESGHRRGGHHHRRLRADQDQSPIEQIGHHTRRDADEQDREERRGLDHGDDRRRGAEVAEQPGRADGLHVGAQVGHELGEEQRQEDPAPQW